MVRVTTGQYLYFGHPFQLYHHLLAPIVLQILLSVRCALSCMSYVHHRIIEIIRDIHVTKIPGLFGDAAELLNSRRLRHVWWAPVGVASGMDAQLLMISKLILRCNAREGCGIA